jgi:serine/threonine-protein kinase
MGEELGRYRIEEEIGQGGFAVVHRAYDTDLERYVALKELRSSLLADSEWIKRFRREARTIARLNHPRIVMIHDVVDHDQRLFIVMHLVDGPALDDHLTSQGRLSWLQTVEIICAVAEALDYAHGEEILHRDLKPANILLDSKRGPLLSDFGLAKLAGEAGTSVTAAGGIVGTAHYIAPEVWEGEGTSKQSDIYALGCILYELLTGQKLFGGDSPPVVMMAHFSSPALPDTWPADIPPGIADILTTALAKNPTERYASAGDLVAALTNLTETKPPSVAPPQPDQPQEKKQPLLTPALIGRSQELSQLERALAAVQTGLGRCARVSGEAGIGKSRLLAEIRSEAAGRGFAILVGRCFEQDMAFPYAPLIDMLRTFFAGRETSDILNSLGSLAPEIARLLPELSSPVVAQQPAAPVDPEIEKRRLFEALAALFLRQTASQPLVLTVEDLHWSDAASLEFLLFLARRIASYPCLLLLSYRSAEIHGDLTPLLTGLDREQFAQALELKRLTRSEVAQMFKSSLDQPQDLSAEFLEAIYNLTEGNPYFAEELFSSLVASGDIFYANGEWRRKPMAQINIPDSVQRLIQQRLNRISRPARQLIDVAAVSGHSFDFAVLQAVTGHSDSDLLSLVKELMAAHLIVEESADQFAFRHTLTREALYARLLARERRIRHGQMAQAIEQIHAGAFEAHLEALAYHFFEAEMWAKALRHHYHRPPCTVSGDRLLTL